MSANGMRPKAPPQTRTTILHVFAWGVRDKDGDRELIVRTPDGAALILPFTPENAQECGAKLMAPSVIRPGTAG